MDDLNLSIIIAQIINFWIIYFIFYHFLWKTIVKVIEDRRVQIDNLEKSDLFVKEKLDAAEKEADKIISETKDHALLIHQNAEKMAKKEATKKVQEAEEKAKWIKEEAERDIEKEKLSMMNSIKSRVIDLSLKLNEKLFEKEKVNADFMEKEINSINI